MSCPQCRGETDPRRRLLESLCQKHRAQLQAIDEQRVRKVIEEGMLDARAVRAAIPMMPGYYR